MTLMFLTVCYCAGLVAWALDLDRYDDATVTSGTIVAGLGAGMFMAAWT